MQTIIIERKKKATTLGGKMKHGVKSRDLHNINVQSKCKARDDEEGRWERVTNWTQKKKIIPESG